MTPAQLAEVKKMCDHAALMQDHERAAAKSNSLTGCRWRRPRQSARR